MNSIPNNLKLILLDRDGVINFDSHEYIKSAQEFNIIPNSLTAIAKLNNHSFKVAIVSNQSGIGRGYFTTDDLHAMHVKLQRELAEVDGHIDGIFVCPHAPEENCGCRKPRPYLLLQACQQFKVKPKQALMIGDAVRDMQAAHAAGCHAVLVASGKEPPRHIHNVPIFSDLDAAVTAILAVNEV